MTTALIRAARSRRTAATTALVGILVALLPAPGALAVPSVTGGGTIEVPYIEQDTPIAIGESILVGGSETYDGQYVEFAVGSPQGTESLTLTTDETPATGQGAVSLVNGTVYLGDGAQAEAVGTVDDARDGTSGQPLRINFSSPFTNASFESGDLTGWTVMEQWINLGVTSIAGFVPTDTATYPIDSGGDGDAPQSATYTSSIDTTGGATDGTLALKLESGMTTANGCDVVHGPAVYSDPFPASGGDSIYFDWRAFSGSDAYHVFGYIIDDQGNNQTEVLDAYSTSKTDTNWTQKETIIPADGNYRFVFVAGTYDATCGLAAGASLYIDNVRVFGNKVTDAVVQNVAQRLQYANASDNPPASQTVTVTAVASDSSSDSDTITINITGVDDAPQMGAITGNTYANTEGADTFADHVTTLPGTDPEDDALSYSLTGSGAEATTIEGVDYTHSLDGTYGTVHLHETTGAVRYVPDVEAFNARSLDDTDAFTFTVAANGLEDTGTMTITVDVPPTATSGPTGLRARAGNSIVDLSWTAPSWLGDAAVTGYRIELTEDGTTWTDVIPDTESVATTFTVEDLTNGTSYEFRVSAINANGTSDPSATAAATPRVPVVAESCEYNESSFSTTHGDWEVPCWSSPDTVEPATDAPGWMALPSAFAIANGLLTPTADGGIAPKVTVSRSEVAVMLRRLAGDPSADVSHSFTDTDGEATEALNWLTSINVVEGVGGGRYDGDRTVNRAEAVTLLWRLAGRPTPVSSQPFSDVHEGWMTEAIAWAAESGIINGRSVTVFDPYAGVNRGELFAILYRWTAGVEASAS